MQFGWRNNKIFKYENTMKILEFYKNDAKSAKSVKFYKNDAKSVKKPFEKYVILDSKNINSNGKIQKKGENSIIL